MPRRAKRSNIDTLGKLDRILSNAQNVAGDLTAVGNADSDPISYGIGNDAWEALEAIRRRILRAM